MDPRSNSLKKWAYVAGLVIIAFSAYQAYQAWAATKTTGSLKVSSADPSASLSITAAGHQAKYIGTGSTKVRLSPGDYLVSASDKGQQSQAAVTIVKHQSQSISIDPTSGGQLPNLGSINFKGFDTLLNKGLTSDQVDLLKLYFFHYKTDSKVAAIDTSSIHPEAHNPSDAYFKTDFNLTIDNQKLKAVVSFSGLSTIKLNLYNQQGQVVFSS